jgi:glycosyltransferase involved in cell wall biosynthesis
MNRSVLLLVDSFLPVIGGKQVLVHWLATSLNRLDYEARVLTGGLGLKNGLKQNYVVHRFPLRPRYLYVLRSTSFLLFERMRCRPGLVHAHNAYPAGYIAACSKRVKNVPLVVTCHGVDVLTEPNIDYGIGLDPVLSRKVSYTLQMADAIIANSEGMKDALLGWGVQKDKIHFIPNGVEIAPLTCESQNVSLSNSNRKQKVILAIGKYRMVKGFEHLVKAVALVAENEAVKCILVGRGMEVLNPLINELKIEDKIELVGETSDYLKLEPSNRLLGFYKMSDVYVSSSLSESFSNTILESMSLELPVVATATIGARGLIKDGITGLLSPVGNVRALADNILMILRDNQLRARVVKNAREESLNYSLERVAMQHIELYDKLLGFKGSAKR